jgi:hypothetical protein
MTRPINGSLTVTSFTSTGNPGEYTFTGAVFNNQADATGNGAADIQPGFLLFIPASDSNSFSPLAGVVHRYKFTATNATDSQTLDGTIVWDEPGKEEDAVTNGAACIVAEATPLLRLAKLPSDFSYSELQTGLSFLAFQVDERNIIDAISGGGTGTPTLTQTLEVIPSGATGIDGYTLLHTPANPILTTIWVNGIRYWYDNDFTLTGKVVNWISNLFSPDQFDSVIAEYSY